MSRLRNLLEERSVVFEKYNEQILGELSNNVIPAVLEMLNLSDQELTKLTWNGVRAVDDDYIMIIGTIKYKSGDIITDGDTTITLDASLVTLLNKLIQVILPLNIVETGSKTDIIEHLKESERLMKEKFAAYNEDQNISMDFGADFDYNDLTDEQIEKLILSGISADKGRKLN